MKKLIVFFALLGVCMVSPCAFAVTETVVLGNVEKINILGNIQRVIIPITFTANSGTAAEATYTLNPVTHGIKGWYLYKVQTDPGGTGPSNGLWDLDITDAKSEVVSRNLVDDRSSTVTQTVYFSSGYPQILDTWSITIGDNAVNSAVAVVYLTFIAN